MKLSLSIAGLLAAILLAGQNIALAASEATAPEVANDAATGTPPQSMPHYLLLERALLQYQSLAAHPDLTQLQALGRRSIKPGEAWEGAPALRRLGLTYTTLPTDYLWGFTATSAEDYVVLLRNLVRPGPLDAASRRYALTLMRSVESDQRWGVSAAADPGTTIAIKDGWLPSDPDLGGISAPTQHAGGATRRRRRGREGSLRPVSSEGF